MKKVIILTIILAAIISVSAVSADDDEWSFDFSTSADTDGGQLDVVNNEVTIQGFKFVIPDGFKHNQSADLIGEDAGEDFPDCDISKVEFDKGDEFIIIKVVYHDDVKFDDKTYEPPEDSVEKQIENQKGFITEYENGVTFDYCKDGKLIEIVAPNEEILTSLLQSSEK